MVAICLREEEVSRTRRPRLDCFPRIPPWADPQLGCHQPSCVETVKTVLRERTQSKTVDPRLSVEQNRPNSLGRLEGNKRHGPCDGP